MKLLSKALKRALSSPSPAKYGALTQPPTLLHPSSSSSFSSSLYSTSVKLSSLKSPIFRTPKPQQSVAPESDQLKPKGAAKVDWPRPSEIPWQAKVANSVHLIGTVREPVQFREGSDGKHYARTVISQGPSHDAPSLGIPITFEGDLAHIASCHLKEKDCIYIVGKLNADSQLSTATNAQPDIQVVVGSINFVQLHSHMKKGIVPLTQEKFAISSLPYDGPRKCDEATLSSWRDLIENPKHWSDYRTNKQKGLVNPRHPDFKSKDGKSVWLNTAPDWALSGLEGLDFDVQAFKPKQTNKSKENLWKSLLENPDKWWDNRLNKVKEKAPDFVHKVNTGEALWLSDAPAWVNSKLPPAKPKPSWGKSKSTLEKKPTVSATM